MKDLREILNVKVESPFWEEAYTAALAEPELPVWLTEAYLRTLHKETGILPSVIEQVVAGAKAVSQVKELVLFVKVLANIIGGKNPDTGAFEIRASKEAFGVLEFPAAPQESDHVLAYKSVGFLPILAHLEYGWNLLKQRGIDEDVLVSTMGIFDIWLSKTGNRGFAVEDFRLYQVFLDRGELTIERLRFQIFPQSPYRIQAFSNEQGDLVVLMDDVTVHRSGHLSSAYGFTDSEDTYIAKVTEDADGFEGHAVCQENCLVQPQTIRLSKKVWHRVFQKGDPIVRIHIGSGPGFTDENCEHAIMRAREIFSRCYPEYKFKAFTTYTWLLAPELAPVLKESSNTYKFRQRFTNFPAGGQAIDVFLYVYQMTVKSPAEVDVEGLSEDNSMRRGVKEQLRQGNYIHESGGFFLF